MPEPMIVSALRAGAGEYLSPLTVSFVAYSPITSAAVKVGLSDLG